MIAKSEVTTMDCNKYVIVKQHIYAECDCECLDHTARAICEKTVRENGDTSAEVFFEFNSRTQLHSQRFSHENKLLWEVRFFFRRLKEALRLIFNKEVFMSTDFYLSADTFEKFVFAIRDSKSIVMNTRTKYDKVDRKAEE